MNKKPSKPKLNPKPKQSFISNTEDDLQVIPDKFNTGCSIADDLLVVSGITKINDINFILGSNGTAIVFTSYGNKYTDTTYTFEGVDFSKYTFGTTGLGLIANAIEVTFKNCVFSNINLTRTPTKIKFIFKQCSIKYFSGSSAKFEKCYFGGSPCDTSTPYTNVTFTDCYFSNVAHYLPTGNTHIDGTQIYGWNNGSEIVAPTDITFTNCRMELPDTPFLNNHCYVNSCVSVCVGNAGSGNNISFNKCILNGGGFSIYTTATNDASGNPVTLNNTSFHNIKVGCIYKWGILYNKGNTQKVTFNNVIETRSLYISSVWKSNNTTNLIVSNDTNQKRTLAVVTSNNIYYYSIPACPLYGQQTKGQAFNSYPFDLQYTIKENTEYVICYDITSSTPSQIRFVNFGEKKVFFNTSLLKSKR